MVTGPRTSTRPSAILLPKGWGAATSTLSDARLSVDHALVHLWEGDAPKVAARLKAAARLAEIAAERLREVAERIRATGLDVEGPLPQWEEGGDEVEDE